MLRKLGLFFRNRAVIVGLTCYLGSLGVLSQNRNFELSTALIVLVVLGLVFPLLAWFATIHATPLLISVRPSAREMIVLVVCIVALSIYLIGAPRWIDHQRMNSLPKFIASIAALIASLAFLWIAFSTSRAISHNGLEIQFHDQTIRQRY